MNRSMPQGDVIDLSEYLSGLRQYRVLIAGVTLACVAVGAVVALTTSPSYVASLTLAVSQPKFGQQPNEAGAVAPASFRPLFESRATAAAVIQELGLDKPPHNLKPSTLLSRVILIEEVHGTNLIKVTATFNDPQRAAAIAQRVAERAVALAQKVNVDEAARTRGFINEQVKAAKARLDQAEADYRNYRERAQVEALQEDVDAVLQERSTLLNLLVQIEGEKAKLARLEDEIKARKRVDVLKKTIDAEPILADAARDHRDQPSTQTGVAGMQLQTESISEVFEKLDNEVATTRASLAELERQRAQLVDVYKVDAAALPQLSNLYARESELARLLVERDLAQKIYLDVAARLEASGLQVGARSAQLEIIDPAVVPDRPESRHLVRDTVVAGLIGLTASLLLAMTLHARRVARRRV